MNIQNLRERLESLATPELEKQEEGLIRLFCFPFLLKQKMPHAKVDTALKEMALYSRSHKIDFIPLLIGALKQEHPLPMEFNEEFLVFCEVMEECFTLPIEERVPSVLLTKAQEYSKGLMKKKLDSLCT